MRGLGANMAVLICSCCMACCSTQMRTVSYWIDCFEEGWCQRRVCSHSLVALAEIGETYTNMWVRPKCPSWVINVSLKAQWLGFSAGSQHVTWVMSRSTAQYLFSRTNPIFFCCVGRERIWTSAGWQIGKKNLRISGHLFCRPPPQLLWLMSKCIHNTFQILPESHPLLTEA